MTTDWRLRHLWLLKELHAGNAFSQDQLWKWIEEARHSQRRDDIGLPLDDIE